MRFWSTSIHSLKPSDVPMCLLKIAAAVFAFSDMSALQADIGTQCTAVRIAPFKLPGAYMGDTQVFVVSGVRTPIGSFQGELKSLSAPALGAHALRAAVERSGIDAAAVDEVIVGNV